MKHLLFPTLALALLTGCAKTDDEKAQAMLAQIDTLYRQGKYSQTLDSITALRDRYPRAVESRRKALAIWQQASLKMAQADVARTDVQLQQVTAQLQTAADRLTRNRLAVRRDSLKARYDAMCGVVRMIRMRQKQE